MSKPTGNRLRPPETYRDLVALIESTGCTVRNDGARTHPQVLRPNGSLVMCIPSTTRPRAYKNAWFRFTRRYPEALDTLRAPISPEPTPVPEPVPAPTPEPAASEPTQDAPTWTRPDVPELNRESLSRALLDLTPVQAAEYFGVSYQTLNRRRHEWGVLTSKDFGSFQAPPNVQLAMIHYYGEGWSAADIGVMLDVNYSTVLAILRYHGVPIRPRGRRSRRTE